VYFERKKYVILFRFPPTWVSNPSSDSHRRIHTTKYLYSHRHIMKDRKTSHRLWMFDILKHLYSQSFSKYLWFKGGTALYFFYALPRFSVDLDMDLIPGYDEQIFQQMIKKLKIFVTSKWWKIKKDGTLAHSHRYIIQYWWEKKLKLEFGSYDYPNTYESKDLFGLEVQTMTISDMFAHKLCALVSRYQYREYLAGRDIFDIHFLLSQHITPTASIIALRSKKLANKELNIKERYLFLIDFIRTHEDHLRSHILDGLWDLIGETSSKHRIKQTFIDETLQMLQVASMS